MGKFQCAREVRLTFEIFNSCSFENIKTDFTDVVYRYSQDTTHKFPLTLLVAYLSLPANRSKT